MEDIFKEVDGKVSSLSKQLYQNVLQWYFSNKDELISNLSEFELYYDEIPNYSKFSKEFTELNNYKIIVLNNRGIVFLNLWQKNMNLSRLNNIISSNKLASSYKDEMSESKILLDLIGMKSRLNKKEVQELLNMFVKEQDSIVKHYENESECRKHFLYWSQYNQKHLVKSTVKSKSKILGK